MATRFQVKRSSVGGVRPTTSDIQPGELAVNINDRILFSANSSTVFEVGSNLTSLAVGNSTVRFTVNATHVAVSNSMALSANGSNGTSGQVLSSNGTGIYWSTPTSTVDTAAQYSWTNTHSFAANVTFDTNTLFVDASNNNVGIGTTTPAFKLDSTGAINAPFFVNPTTITLSYTIPTNYNAVTTGPITIANAVTVTVSDGSRWVVI